MRLQPDKQPTEAERDEEIVMRPHGNAPRWNQE
jgi:hypothetical protein